MLKLCSRPWQLLQEAEPVQPTMAVLHEAEPVQPTMADVPEAEPVQPTMAVLREAEPVQPNEEPGAGQHVEQAPRAVVAEQARPLANDADEAKLPQLTDWENGELLRMKPLMGPSGQGNPQGKSHEWLQNCCVCDCRKHLVKWQMRSKGKGSAVTGGWCYSCKQAAGKLGCGYQVNLVKAIPSVQAKLLEASKRIRAKLIGYDGDRCVCSKCETARREGRPTKRLRSKTAP